jgi:hypothetical protein
VIEAELRKGSIENSLRQVRSIPRFSGEEIPSHFTTEESQGSLPVGSPVVSRDVRRVRFWNDEGSSEEQQDFTDLPTWKRSLQKAPNYQDQRYFTLPGRVTRRFDRSCNLGGRFS